MKTIKKELLLLRTFALCTTGAILFLFTSAFKNTGNQKFGTIDVERINIIEKDGTVKMVLTNVDQFPNGKEIVNNRHVNSSRKKRAGMLFFNEEGMECGGLIYDGAKKENGHSSGFSLTFDQYDGDQVMQLLTKDKAVGNKRFKTGGLIFNDRADGETQLSNENILNELNSIQDPELRKKKQQEYKDKGQLGAVPRVYLGQSGSKNNGLFLFDTNGKPKAMFYVDKNNKAKLEILNEKGTVISSWPE